MQRYRYRQLFVVCRVIVLTDVSPSTILIAMELAVACMTNTTREVSYMRDSYATWHSICAIRCIESACIVHSVLVC